MKARKVHRNEEGSKKVALARDFPVFKSLAQLAVLSVVGALAWANVLRSGLSQVQAGSKAPASAGAAFGPTVPNTQPPPGPAPKGMVWIPGGEFSMGAGDPPDVDMNMVGMQATEDSRPIHRVYVDGFFRDKTDVTNAQFAAFVKATGYITIAEKTPTQADFPGAPPENLYAGGVVFSPPNHAVSLNDHFQWWSYAKGANWRHPTGPNSSIKGKDDYPVVHAGDALVLPRPSVRGTETSRRRHQCLR